MADNRADTHYADDQKTMIAPLPPAVDAPVHAPAPVKHATAKLVLRRALKRNLEWTLPQGVNTIGRQDPVYPSDIAIKGDSTISRQSLRLDVDYDSATPFRLTVLKASNPVKVNNETVAQGNTVTLTYGDSISLGRTILIMEKA